MENTLQIVFDDEGRVILETSPAMREILLEALQIAKEEQGVVRADLTQVTSAATSIPPVDDPPCRPSVGFKFARIDDPPCRPEIPAKAEIPRVGVPEE